MKLRITNIMYLALISLLLQGCSGVRYSYKPKLEQTSEGAVLRLEKDQVTEVIAIGDGFPGWWGFYPSVTTAEPSVASIDCQKRRSSIPFREPGVIFGGEVCTLIAHEAGKTSLWLGNALSTSKESYSKKFDIIVSEN